MDSQKCDFCSEDAWDFSVIIEDEETGTTSGDGKARCLVHYEKWLADTVKNRNKYLRDHPEEAEEPIVKRRKRGWR